VKVLVDLFDDGGIEETKVLDQIQKSENDKKCRMIKNISVTIAVTLTNRDPSTER